MDFEGLTFYLCFLTIDDHSRVVLSQQKYTAGEDYINASFIDVCNSALVTTMC